MAEITTTQSFSDGDTVTATKLNNIQANASVQPDAITNRTAETTIDQANDLLLIYDASATALKKVSASNLIKAGTASDFPITGNATIGGTLGVTGTSTLTGAITATSTINGTTIPTTKTLVTTVDTQTLTNKTLTTPVISSITNTGTLTLPTATDTLVGRATTDTLTNKTLTSPIISSITNTGTITLPTATDTLVGRATTDTLANKTLTSPSISTPTITGQITASTSVIDVGSGQIYKDATGNVGIGTQTPNSVLPNSFTSNANNRILEVRAVGTFDSGIFIRRGGDDVGLDLWQQAASGAVFIDSQYNGVGGDINFRTKTLGTPVNAMTIQASGNVGIGQSSLTSTLTVNKTGTDTVIQLQEGGSNTAQIESYQSSLYLNVAGANNIIFRPNSTERLRIASAGQIGIGGANYGTSGQVLTSAGVSAAPSWTTISTTPADGSITFAKLSTSATEADNVASRVAKAWVNFSGETGAINGGDFNVTSVTDSGIGSFIVNFSSALSTANFASSISISGTTVAPLDNCICGTVASTTTGTATLRFATSFIPGKDNSYPRDVTSASFICFV